MSEHATVYTVPSRSQPCGRGKLQRGVAAARRNGNGTPDEAWDDTEIRVTAILSLLWHKQPRTEIAIADPAPYATRKTRFRGESR